MAKKKLTVSLLGFDERSAKALTAGMSAFKDRIELIDKVTKGETEVVLIDMDCDDAATIWEEFRPQNPHMPVVVLAKADTEIENTFFVQKPLKLEELIDTFSEAIICTPQLGGEAPQTKSDETALAADLSKVAQNLASRSSHTSQNTRKLGSLNPDEIYFKPETYILGLVLQGIEQGEKSGDIAKIECLLERTINIDAKNNLVYSNLKDVEMRQIAIAPLGKGENGLDTQLQMVKASDSTNLKGGGAKVLPVDQFVWQLAVLTSKGRIPEGTPMDEPVYLMQWPNLTRFAPLPNAMAITAQWIRMAASLTDLANQVDVPLNDVLSLYTAASLSGIAGIAKRKEDHLMRNANPVEHEKRNLFGSIMGNLKDTLNTD